MNILLIYLAISYHQPRFCSDATWRYNATTVSASTAGINAAYIFINKNNMISVANPTNSTLIMWNDNNSTPIQIIKLNSSQPYSHFVMDSDDIYIDSFIQAGQVGKWFANSTLGQSVMYPCSQCYGLFVDIDNNIYCSINDKHQVVAQSLNDISNRMNIVAGTGISGSNSDMLSSPYQIYVDTNLDLYVADSGNNRVQCFQVGHTNGTTVAGVSSHYITITLNSPTGIVLDGDRYLYITDSGNNRIVASGPSGFRCLVGCSSLAGSTADKLNSPVVFSFNGHGDMLVVDKGNSRIQKFHSRSNLCYNVTVTITKTSTSTTTTTSTQSSNQHLTTITSANIMVSYNRPKLNENSTWYENATTFADTSVIGDDPYAIFIDIYNTVYFAASNPHQLITWSNGSSIVTNTLPGYQMAGVGLFVTLNGDIYLEKNTNGEVHKWNVNSNTTVLAVNMHDRCQGLFIDINNMLYCSQSSLQRVVFKSLNDESRLMTIVAGTGCSGSSSLQLSQPSGIFVDTNLNLYVADTANNRVQCFPSGQTSGITVAGSSSLNTTITLSSPSCVMLDFDGNLFVLDSFNHRVVRSGSNGFWCIVGCTGAGGSDANQLNYPQYMAFDSHGNIFVTDVYNSRIQKFEIINIPSEATTAVNEVYPTTNPTTSSVSSTTVVTTNDLDTTAFTSHQTATEMMMGHTTTNIVTTITVQSATTLSTEAATSSVAEYGTIIEKTSATRTTENVMSTSMLESTESQTEKATVVSKSPQTQFTADISTEATEGGDTTIDWTTIENGRDEATSTIAVSTTHGDKTNTNSGKSLVSSSSPSSQTTTEPAIPAAMNSSSCLLSTITLIPAISSVSLAIEFHRNEDFYISSTIDINCNNSMLMAMEWTMKACTPNCLNVIQLDESIGTTFSEIYFPPRSLPCGIYKLQLTVTANTLSQSTNTAFTFVKIIPSDIQVYLIRLGTSMITHSYQQDLKLDPGTYSIDFNGYEFNASDWLYEYYCRTYDTFTANEPMLPIGSLNSSCLINQTSFTYDGVLLSHRSSMSIYAGSMSPNKTYQFIVSMQNRQNSSIQITGSALVKIENSPTKRIIIGCVIQTMCTPNIEYQLVNPSTQIALYAECIDTCDIQENITWNIYYGEINSSSNATQWMLFNQMNLYDNIWFYGRNTSNFTASKDLFSRNSQFNLWRFEVIYGLLPAISSSALDFTINQPPSNGSCSISPLSGTTSTVFHISCTDWFDENGIKEYSLYVWSTDPSDTMIKAFSSISTFQVRLPAGTISLIVHIRDKTDCVTEYNIPTSVVVLPDSSEMTSLIKSTTHNYINRLFSSGNQNLIGQIITSISIQFNSMSYANINNAISNGLSPTNIFISSLGNSSLPTNSISSYNQSVLIEYDKRRNSLANIRSTFAKFIPNVAILGSSSIQLQAAMLVHLTQSTNELSRQTLTIVSKQCYQLTLALCSMASRISADDVRRASNQLIQCASNVLTAVNGPLQSRTDVLDEDFIDATSFPTDYDTDIESPWSNLNLFADGNDFSWETIEKNRNLYYQKELANQILDQMNTLISKITSAMNIHLTLNQNLLVNTSAVFMLIEKRTLQSLTNIKLDQTENAHIQLPTNLDNNSSVLLRSMLTPLAPFGNTTTQTTLTNLSRSVSLSIFDLNEFEILVQTSERSPIQIVIPHDSNLRVPSMILQDVISMNSTFSHQLFNLHYLNITNSLPISLHFQIEPLKENISYLFIYKFDQSPRLNSSINQIDGWTLFCSSNLTTDNLYKYFIDNRQTSNHRSIIFGLRELQPSESVCSNSSPTNPPITDKHMTFTGNYQLRIYASGCYYLDSNNQWKSDGLVVGERTTLNATECYSTHLTTFTSAFCVLPNPINWNYVFSNAEFMKNKTTYFTVICVSVIYLILLIFARYKDKKDAEKLGVTVLPDNHKLDDYFYEIIVFTGQRKDAGTKSNVQFILCGNDHQTRIRTLIDPQRSILQRGGIDAFLMSVPKSLGLLNFIRIWHDNSGKGSSASWFLKYLIVRDLQTMETFHFICQKWFAVEKEDGKIHRILPVASEMEKHQFRHILSKHAYSCVSDSHLWFSIFSRPPSSHFTRVQRCTCCFVLLFVSMFLNIMYYDLANEAKASDPTKSLSLTFGTLYITHQQVIVGIVVELFALLPSFLLVQMFRRIRYRQKQSSTLQSTFPKIRADSKFVERKNKRKTLPWWFIFIAYGICIVLVGVSIVFIVGRGIEFGDLKTGQWLTSILSGFLSSILLVQPLKILCLILFFGVCCRKALDDEEIKDYFDNQPIELDRDEEYLHMIRRTSIFIYRNPVYFNRLNKTEVACAREIRLKEIQMWAVVNEGLMYLGFLILLYSFAYSNHFSNSFYQVDHLRKYLTNSRQIDANFSKISTVDDCWNWLENSFMRNLRAQTWYNGDAPRNLSGFINDKSNRLIGWATMRQLRVKSQLCPIHNSIAYSCVHDYSFFDHDEHSYYPGWRKNQSNTNYSSTISNAFKYKSSEQLGTYAYVGDHETYEGGGYVYEFRGRLSSLQSNISQLHQLDWIDTRTRAVIIQLSLYNANVELFTSVIFLIEKLSTGGFYSTIRVEPMHFYTFTSVWQLICTIVYLIVIIYFMVIEIRLLIRLKRKYFLEFWSLIQWSIIVCSWISVAIYIWRYNESKRIGQLFKETKGHTRLNLQMASYVNHLLTSLFALCCFFSTMKFLRLCVYNSQQHLFLQSIKYAANELSLFMLMFSVIVLAFVCLFYLLFNSKLQSCSTLFAATKILVKMILMKANGKEFLVVSPFLGPFVFTLCAFIVVFICINMFLSITMRSFQHARRNQTKNNREIFAFMFNRLLHWIGLKRTTREEFEEARNHRKDVRYLSGVELFPEKMNQFLDALNKIYLTQEIGKERVKEIVG
ncbi:unnamed protein product [Adineta ricciae]|uniref:PLAT domain-containing protein n=1 Tax=Adineta ricciae TaxID=249248 RepID=A0A814N9L9_ADIRI|nr:unnamed protein product [Adineta ricciae]